MISEIQVSSVQAEKQITQREYRKGALYLEGAASWFNLSINKQTRGIWEAILVGMCEGDHWIDKQRDALVRKNGIVKTISYIGGYEKALPEGSIQFYQGMHELRGVVASSPVQKQNLFIADLIRLCNVTEAIKRSRTPEDFAKWSYIEGDVTASLLVDLLPDDLTSQPGYRDFEKFLRNISRTVNVVDSMVDVKKDRENAEIVVEGTTGQIVRALGKRIVRDALRISPQILDSEQARNVIVDIVKMGKRTSSS